MAALTKNESVKDEVCEPCEICCDATSVESLDMYEGMCAWCFLKHEEP